MIEWLQKHWFLIVALTTMSAAWGQSQLKIQSLEEAVKASASLQKEFQQMREQAIRVDERTVSIQKTQESQEKKLDTLINLQLKALERPEKVK